MFSKPLTLRLLVKVGDLVRNKHTVLGSISDERGVVVKIDNKRLLDDFIVLVVWHNSTEVYKTWMEPQDLEVVSGGR